MSTDLEVNDDDKECKIHYSSVKIISGLEQIERSLSIWEDLLGGYNFSTESYGYLSENERLFRKKEEKILKRNLIIKALTRVLALFRFLFNSQQVLKNCRFFYFSLLLKVTQAKQRQIVDDICLIIETKSNINYKAKGAMPWLPVFA